MYFEIVPVDGGFKARIRANNHEVVFVSDTTYKTKLSAEGAIAIVMNGAANAAIRERS